MKESQEMQWVGQWAQLLPLLFITNASTKQSNEHFLTVDQFEILQGVMELDTVSC